MHLTSTRNWNMLNREKKAHSRPKFICTHKKNLLTPHHFRIVKQSCFMSLYGWFFFSSAMWIHFNWKQLMHFIYSLTSIFFLTLSIRVRFLVEFICHFSFAIFFLSQLLITLSENVISTKYNNTHK